MLVSALWRCRPDRRKHLLLSTIRSRTTGKRRREVPQKRSSRRWRCAAPFSASTSSCSSGNEKAAGIAAATNRHEQQGIGRSQDRLPSSALFYVPRFLSEIHRSAKRRDAAEYTRIPAPAEAAARPCAFRKTCKSYSRRCSNYRNFGIGS